MTARLATAAKWRRRLAFWPYGQRVEIIARHRHLLRDLDRVGAAPLDLHRSPLRTGGRLSKA